MEIIYDIDYDNITNTFISVTLYFSPLLCLFIPFCVLISDVDKITIVRSYSIWFVYYHNVTTIDVSGLLLCLSKWYFWIYTSSREFYFN